MNTTKEMCPFCPLLVEDELCEPIDYDFFGYAATIQGIRSCAYCAQIAAMDDDEGAWMVEALKAEQAKQA